LEDHLWSDNPAPAQDSQPIVPREQSSLKQLKTEVSKPLTTASEEEKGSCLASEKPVKKVFLLQNVNNEPSLAS